MDPNPRKMEPGTDGDHWVGVATVCRSADLLPHIAISAGGMHVVDYWKSPSALSQLLNQIAGSLFLGTEGAGHVGGNVLY